MRTSAKGHVSITDASQDLWLPEIYYAELLNFLSSVLPSDSLFAEEEASQERRKSGRARSFKKKSLVSEIKPAAEAMCL